MKISLCTILLLVGAALLLPRVTNAFESVRLFQQNPRIHNVHYDRTVLRQHEQLPLQATSNADSSDDSGSGSGYGLEKASDDDFETTRMMAELTSRIASLQQGIQQELLQQVNLPVVAMDALLPGQRYTGQTSDPTFGRFLQELGLGGLFVMTSINHKQRKLRRNGCIVRINVVDAPAAAAPTLTAVDFNLVGRKRCRLVGPAEGLQARVGRWRRSYDPDGETTRLGWGVERFVDSAEIAASFKSADSSSEQPNENSADQLLHDQPSTVWSTQTIDCDLVDADCESLDVQELAASLLPVLDEWYRLASSTATYDNTKVFATTRVMKGQTGLRVDPAALLRQVQNELGPRPDPRKQPTEFAVWGAAFMNPIPPLGVSPEIRGRVLEATDALSRLRILEWGLKRSIANLNGSAPL